MLADWGVSIRTACRVLPLDRSTHHYKSRRPGQAGLEQRIEETSYTQVRYGYCRVQVLLRREGGVVLNVEKILCIYSELGLRLCNKHSKWRTKAKLREDRRDAVGRNEVWAMDFVHDQLAMG